MTLMTLILTSQIFQEGVSLSEEAEAAEVDSVDLLVLVIVVSETPSEVEAVVSEAVALEEVASVEVFHENLLLISN